jgi:PhzF family phenazine biosynthesis protein
VKLALYQVDAFASSIFAGNPAAVCPLDEWLPDKTMQNIAAENNLSETAFFVRAQDGFDLRWFTPAVEVDLCGHATLASAYVLYEHLGEKSEQLTFTTKSGKLTVTRKGEFLAMELPTRAPIALEANRELIRALGAEPAAILGARDYLVVYDSEQDVHALQPDMAGLMNIDRFAVIATAPGNSCDFVSRFFAPAKGVPEDPVTGSAHCTLVPYWAERLAKTNLHAKQISRRGGELFCEMRGDRVEIAGRCALYLIGSIYVPVTY